MKRLAATLLVLTLATSVAQFSIAAGAAQSTEVSTAERERNIQSFEQVWKTVRDRHWDPKMNGVDWQAVHDELRPQIEKADSNEKARRIINDMLSRLKQSHFGVLAGEIQEQVQPGAGSGAADSGDGQTGLDVRLVGEQVLVTSVEEGSAAGGIRPGWEVLAIDGKELAPIVSRVTAALQGSNLQPLAVRAGVLAALAGKPGSTARLRLRDGQGQVVDLPVSRVQPRGLRTQLGILPPMYVWSEWRKMDGGFGYLVFNMFMDPENVMKTVSTAVTSCQDCPGLVIDLRGNPGGLGAMAMGLAGWFVEEKGRRLGTMYTREAELRFVINPRPVIYRGPLAILIDGCTGSTAEIFSGGLKDLQRARIFGARSAGAALPAAFEKLPNGDVFLYAFASYISAGGQALEGNGVTPDVDVPLTRESLLRDRDPVLKSAIEWMRQQK